MRPRLYAQDEDEFQQELEPLEEDGTEDGAPEAKAPSHGPPRLLVNSTVAKTIQVDLQADGRLDWDQQGGVRVHLLASDSNDFLYCPCCSTQDRRANLFRPVRLGAPFLLQTAIPVLLRHLPPYSNSASALPFDGRRLISFTDSRQGTARFAAKTQLETERDFVRSLLYHSVADRARPTDCQTLEVLHREITTLEQVIRGNPSLEASLGKMLAEKRAELQAGSTPALGRLSWQEAQNKLRV